MERGVHRGKWNKKAPVGTILILMCMIIPTLTLLEPQPSVVPTCPPGDFLTDKGICCNTCSQGFKLVEECHRGGERTKCARCPPGQYTDKINYHRNCRTCRQCKPSKHEIEVSPCTRQQNTICGCEDGYYKSFIDSDLYQCRKCKLCGPDERLKRTCTPESNTECECKENYYKVKNKCEPCKNCTTECKQHCPSMNTKAPDLGKDYLINILGGAIAVVVVALVLVAIITYMVTKRSTKKKLLKLTSQTSDVSTDSCKEILIVEPSNNNSVNAVPQSPVSEQEQSSKLPDCVPLEIRIPDLIYTVLDLVPVLQVKQLVRALGVRDTEIEQAELDHRSCRECHYQMLRVWAERGSRAGGMLHWPLLLQLLDELRKMHLGWAAEELETKYNIQ
ncbi:tumor necrosis factor receptor superfamily member 1A [Symphorus nematophorus]